MPRTPLFAVAVSALLLAAATPAVAGYGAFALDEAAHKFGYSSNQSDQKHADALALKNCKSSDCKVVFPIPPRQCGAFASGEKGTAWGGAVKPTRDAAQLAAVEDCQKHTPGHCKVQQSTCNR